MFTLKTTLSTAAFILLSGLYLSAGDLTPPAGAPSSTMKTLDQIESRTLLKPQAGEILVIDEPGNYFLSSAVPANVDLSIKSGSVVLDLGGFAHIFSGNIYINVQSDAREVRLINGTLLNDVSISSYQGAALVLEQLRFEGGKVQVESRYGLELLGCYFVSSGEELTALSIQDSTVVAEDCLFQGYTEAVVLSGNHLDNSARFEGCRFIGNTIGVLAFWEGSTYLDNCFFEGATASTSQSYCAVENALGKVEVVDSRFRNFQRVFFLTHL